MTKDLSLKISIALCVHNGERYLAEQLESFLSQTCPPYELVACDDASEDATQTIIEAFATRAPFPVRFHRNPIKLGVNANFERAIRLCQGDVIILSDQDDVWLPHKLEVFDKVFMATPEIGWAYCDANVVSDSLQPFGYTMWERVSFTRREQKVGRKGNIFKVLLKHYVVAGAAMAFRANLRERLFPVPAGWAYDAWLAVLAAAFARCALIEEPLQLYRQHSSNAVGARRKSTTQQICEALRVDRKRYYREELVRWSQLMERITAVHAPASAREALIAKLVHLERRASLPDRRLLRLPKITAELISGGYHRYARNWGSVAFDLLFR
ncbi:glycosyltransferase family 2 protein [Sulfurirhabdus autotrophica]|uniref:Glycosyl transferase family 2 n=1 Tax=Sulfurirhabdus autotrophica TaxID=1706046 RepID=A0A4R3XT00_9PROT|nr:glycosyltransferase family 2 protein [Sulfurirhabdus autotrophica]TCV79101.1 glycosyl transferase family 2 [Sulfurirhabdus autotrophica]